MKNQTILFLRNNILIGSEELAISKLNEIEHKKGQPVIIYYGSGEEDAKFIFAIGKKDGVGENCYDIIANSSDLLEIASLIEELTSTVTNHVSTNAGVSYGHVITGGDITYNNGVGTINSSSITYDKFQRIVGNNKVLGSITSGGIVSELGKDELLTILGDISAVQFKNNKTIELTGDVTGTVSSNFSGDTITINTTVEDNSHSHIVDNITGLTELINNKQDSLVSGENIKTVNGESLLGEGNIEISSTGGIEDAPVDDEIYGRSNNSWEKINIIPPDEETISSTLVSEKTVLSIPNKDKSSSNGLGYKIIRKTSLVSPKKCEDYTADFIPCKVYVTNGSVGSVAETINDNQFYKYKVIDCQEGDKFKVTGYGSSDAKLWCFLSAENKILSSTSGTGISCEIITAPADTAKLVVNSMMDSNCNVLKILNEEEEEQKYLLSQDEFSTEDTIYEIRYNFTLNNETLTLPKNSQLYFNGGSISDGVIVGNRTKINSEPYWIFQNISPLGNYDLDDIYTEWFGSDSFYKKTRENSEQTGYIQISVPNEVFQLRDSSNAINTALYLSSMSGGEVVLLSRIYRIDQTVEMGMRSVLRTDVDSLIVVNMIGDGLKKKIHSTADGTFSEEESEEAYYTLAANEFFPTSQMRVAFRLSPIRTRILGGGSITLYPKSRRTIGILCRSTGYMYPDMTYMSPVIDVCVFGEKKNICSPDPRDLVGEGAPTAEIGQGNTTTIYYWDKKTKAYYQRASGGSWVINNWEADPHWNTCLRFEVIPASFSGRICNPNIKIGAMYGARGIEVVINGEGSWFNESTVSGSVSEMYSNYLSVYCEKGGNFSSHNWENIVCQSSNKGMYDSSMFYCINGNGTTLGHFWDVSWLGTKQKYSYYLGKLTSGISIPWLDGSIKDEGSGNKYSGSPLSYGDSTHILGQMYYNLFDKSFNSTNGGSNIGGIIKEQVTDENINNSLETVTSGQTPSKYLFDGDMSTSVEIINTTSSIWGYGLKFGSGLVSNPFLNYRYNAFITLKFTVSDAKKAYDNRHKIRCLYAPKGWIEDRFTNTTRFKEFSIIQSVAYGNGQLQLVTTAYLKVDGHSSDNGELKIFATEDIPDFSMKLISVEYLIDSCNINSRYPKNPYNTLANCPPNGYMYFDNNNKKVKVNHGDAVTPEWHDIYEESNSFVDHGTEDTTYKITPDVFHKWDVVSKLTLTLSDPSSTKEYMVQFSSGDTPTVLSISGVKWVENPIIDPNSTYQVSILNNLALIGGWSNE